MHLSESYIELHCKRIADHLELGEGVWWKREVDTLVFFDGDREPATRPEGPPLMSFETHMLGDVHQMLPSSWKRCQEKGIDAMVRLYPGKTVISPC